MAFLNPFRPFPNSEKGIVMTYRTLILAPHIDDEVLGCFSFLSEASFVLWFGLGCFDETKPAERLAEAESLASHLGFGFEILDHPVNRYRTDRLIQDIETKIIALQPQTVLLPTPSYNQDHRAVFDAGLTATRPHDRLPFTREVLVYEQVHAALWPRDRFQPQYFRSIDIQEKLEAWQKLPSQHREHRSPQHIRTLAQWRGNQAKVGFAEGFQVLRWVAS